MPPKAFSDLPNDIRRKIFQMNCASYKIHHSPDGETFRIKPETDEHLVIWAPMTARVPMLLVSKEVNREFTEVIFQNFTHVLPSPPNISEYLYVLASTPDVLESIKNFEVEYTGEDVNLLAYGLPGVKPPEPSLVEARMAELVGVQDRIGPGYIPNNPQMRHSHGILLKKLFRNWTSKRKFVLKHVLPERIILRLELATCPGGCHHLYRSVLYSWLDEYKRFPAGLQVKGLPHGQDLGDLIIGMGGTIGPLQ